MGGAYGRRVVVIAGKGNNGADGRVAAAAPAPARGAGRRWSRRSTRPSASARRRRWTWSSTPPSAPGSGASTGPRPCPPACRCWPWTSPPGVDGDTGEACGEPLRADLHRHLRRAQARACSRATGPCWPAGWWWPTSASTSAAASIGLVEDGGRGRPPPAAAARRAQVAVGGGGGGGQPGHDRRRRAVRPRRVPGRRGHGPPRRPRRRRPPSCPPARRWARRCRRTGWADDALAMARALPGHRASGPGLGRAPETRPTTSAALVGRVGGARGGRRRRPLRPGHRRRGRPAALAGGAAGRCSPRTTASSPAWPGRRPGSDRIGAARRLAARVGAVVLLEGADHGRGRARRASRCW